MLPEISEKTRLSIPLGLIFTTFLGGGGWMTSMHLSSSATASTVKANAENIEAIQTKLEILKDTNSEAAVKTLEQIYKTQKETNERLRENNILFLTIERRLSKIEGKLSL